MKVKPRFTVEDHIAVGNTLKAAWLAYGRVLMAFPRSSRASRAARRLERALLSLKSELDEEVLRLVKQEQDPRHLVTKVYYGEPLVKRDQDTQDTQDAFAQWEREQL